MTRVYDQRYDFGLAAGFGQLPYPHPSVQPVGRSLHARTLSHNYRPPQVRRASDSGYYGASYGSPSTHSFSGSPPLATEYSSYQRIKQLDSKPGAEKGGPMSNGIWLVQKYGTSRYFVEKTVKITRTSRKHRTMREIAALKSVRGHPNINQIQDYFFDNTAGKCSIILDYCTGGALDAMVVRYITAQQIMPEAFIWHVFSGLANALAFLHYGALSLDYPPSTARKWNTVCHVDIKPANVFLAHDVKGTFPRVVLGDFGCSVTLADLHSGVANTEFQEHGTKGWFPPENSGATKMPGYYGPETDIWQVGGVVHVLCRLLPAPVMRLIEEGRACGRVYSKELNNAVLCCMQEWYKDRPLAVDLAQELKRIAEEKSGKGPAAKMWR